MGISEADNLGSSNQSEQSTIYLCSAMGYIPLGFPPEPKNKHNSCCHQPIFIKSIH